MSFLGSWWKGVWIGDFGDARGCRARNLLDQLADPMDGDLAGWAEHVVPINPWVEPEPQRYQD